MPTSSACHPKHFATACLWRWGTDVRKEMPRHSLRLMDRLTSNVSNWPPSAPVFLDIYRRSPDSRPSFQAVNCHYALPDEFDRLSLDLPDKLLAYRKGKDRSIVGDLPELASTCAGHENRV